MNKSSLLTGVLALACWSVTEWPQADLSNGQIEATLYLPDAVTGFYQGTRFDWAGAFKRLTYKGHSFVENWFDSYDPKLHDAINGPAEEFVPLNFAEAKAGETFVKIGVGVLRKPDDKPYAFSRNYEIADAGTRTIRQRKDRIEFSHQVTDAGGYAYTYQKTVRLVKHKPVLVLEHRLKNTGKKPISTSTYNHNFFIIDHQPTGPTVNIEFPYAVSAEGRGFGSLIRTEGNRLVYDRVLLKGEQVYTAGLQGLSGKAGEYDIRIENLKTGAGIHIEGDKPLEKLVYWACSTTSCPEPYIKIDVAPGKEFRWQIRYTFYEKRP